MDFLVCPVVGHYVRDNCPIPYASLLILSYSPCPASSGCHGLYNVTTGCNDRASFKERAAVLDDPSSGSIRTADFTELLLGVTQVSIVRWPGRSKTALKHDAHWHRLSFFTRRWQTEGIFGHELTFRMPDSAAVWGCYLSKRPTTMCRFGRESGACNKCGAALIAVRCNWAFSHVTSACPNPGCAVPRPCHLRQGVHHLSGRWWAVAPVYAVITHTLFL